jgi:CheY-like chemotaxis protein
MHGHSQGNNQWTILLVDDDPEVRAALDEPLRLPGYNVAAVDSAEAALDRLEQKPADLTITDVNMAGMSGIALCARLKGDPRYQLMPVIILTGADDLDTRVESARTSACSRPSSPSSS